MGLSGHLLAAARELTAYSLLFVARVLHDIGLADRASRFEVDGADVAAELLRGHGCR